MGSCALVERGVEVEVGSTVRRCGLLPRFCDVFGGSSGAILVVAVGREESETLIAPSCCAPASVLGDIFYHLLCGLRDGEGGEASSLGYGCVCACAKADFVKRTLVYTFVSCCYICDT